MGKYPRLQRRGNRYYLRAKVPDELVSILGRREIVRSLGVGDYRDAVNRLQLKSIKVDAEFAEARRKLTLRPITELSDFDLTQMAVLWLHRAEQEDFKSLPVAASGEKDEWIAPDIHPKPNKQLQGARSEKLIKGTAQRIVDRLLGEMRIQADPESDQYNWFCALICRAVAEHLRRQSDRELAPIIHDGHRISAGRAVATGLTAIFETDCRRGWRLLFGARPAAPAAWFRALGR